MSSSESNELGFDVRVAKDASAAWLIFRPGAGKGVLPTAVVSEAAGKGVRVTETVEARIVDVLREHAPADESIQYVLAEATPPVPGRDATIEWRPGLVPDLLGSAASTAPGAGGHDDANSELGASTKTPGDGPFDARADEDVHGHGAGDAATAFSDFDASAEDVPAAVVGDDEAADTSDGDTAVDHYARNSDLSTVHAGDEVGDLVTATAGAPGMDVCGNEIDGRPGRTLPVALCPKTLELRDDVVIALASGHIRADEHHALVDPIMEIEGDVDFGSGNVDFAGAVLVRGGVKDRFVVRALGDVKVIGLVQGATMLAGGRFELHRGMAAKERGQIVVDGDCETGFFNGVRGRVGGTLLVRRELMECELVIGGDLVAETAACVGGSYVVTGRAVFAALGSRAGAPTRVILGEVPMLARRLRRLGEMIEPVAVQVDEAQEQLRTLEQTDGVTEDAIAPLREAQMERLQRFDVMESVRSDVARQIRDARTVDLRASRLIGQRVCLTIRGQDYSFDDQVPGPVRVFVNDADVPMVQIGDRSPAPLTSVASMCTADRQDFAAAA
ncbi:MAG: FapA family protein [Phycisphaerales bacterium]